MPMFLRLLALTLTIAGSYVAGYLGVAAHHGLLGLWAVPVVLLLLASCAVAGLLMELARKS